MKILVVVDMQNDFTTGVLGNAECKAAIDKVAQVIEEGGYDGYLFTMDTHTEDYLNTREGKNLPVEHCIVGTRGWELVPGLKEAALKKTDRVLVFKKPTFGSELLGSYIKNEVYNYCGEEELVVDFVGVCTGICVISNVMMTKACCPEAKIRVLSKACACVTPQSHQTALEAMKTCQVEIV